MICQKDTELRTERHYIAMPFSSGNHYNYGN